MGDTKEKISDLDSEKVAGGVEAICSDQGGIWRPNCPKCGKEMLGGIGVNRVDGTVYEHPYFCEECATGLTDEEKINS